MTERLSPTWHGENTTSTAGDRDNLPPTPGHHNELTPRAIRTQEELAAGTTVIFPPCSCHSSRQDDLFSSHFSRVLWALFPRFSAILFRGEGRTHAWRPLAPGCFFGPRSRRRVQKYVHPRVCSDNALRIVSRVKHPACSVVRAFDARRMVQGSDCVLRRIQRSTGRATMCCLLARREEAGKQQDHSIDMHEV